jgi:hypothetical protein
MPKKADDPVDTPVDTPKERLLVDKLVARGLELDVEDDDSLLESMEQLLSDRESAPDRSEFERLKKLEPFATEYTQHAADFQQWKAEQAKRAEAPKDDDEPKPQSPPKVDAALSQIVYQGVQTGAVVRTTSGLYEAKDPNYAGFVQQLNTAQLQRREFFQRFEDDPGAFVAEYAQPHIKAVKKQYEEDLKAIKEEMGKLRKQHSEESIEKFFERNYQEYWVTGEDGSIVKDARGQGTLSARGRMYSQAMNDLKEDIPDEDKRHLRAVALAKQVPIETEQPEAQPADRKKRFLKRASEKPGRTTDRLVEQTSATKADAQVTAGKKRGRMDWDELMRVTAASMQ